MAGIVIVSAWYSMKSIKDAYAIFCQSYLNMKLRRKFLFFPEKSLSSHILLAKCWDSWHPIFALSHWPKAESIQRKSKSGKGKERGRRMRGQKGDLGHLQYNTTALQTNPPHDSGELHGDRHSHISSKADISGWGNTEKLENYWGGILQLISWQVLQLSYP